MPSARDETEVARFVERFAVVLADAGFPRMPARVFTALIASDDGRHTAAELSERLQASPAAISGAVRYLMQIRFVSREREPGSRRDRYVVHDDIWFEATVRRDEAIARMITVLSDGRDVVGPQTPAGRRLAESIDFFSFLLGEMPAMLERWRASRA
ncbi:GbsR/MarR family transcriptional regulator [Conexibacter woesei]|uniref:HTH marR-type domain-containing protein n=1 Tax=Conexibacter woesei (strain DSM 14684 / CCUG 47730 / CIP 108061 / JCM 11494 / NBRC 100937 / ID131577) TaxID=469383 RepID=D3FFK3_CONWI|nr:MarR family transcriptional regulator [Conexibacter woesei]ADB53796.1 conserved hypothetical protein [Conexibacter woesei DSM 14684]